MGSFAIGLFSGAFVKGKETYERAALVNRKYFDRRGMEKKILVFGTDNTLADVAKRMQGNYLYCLEVVDEDMHTLVTFDIAQLESIVLTKPLTATLKEIVNSK